LSKENSYAAATNISIEYKLVGVDYEEKELINENRYQNSEIDSPRMVQILPCQ
jgi:hypothetical protein